MNNQEVLNMYREMTEYFKREPSYDFVRLEQESLTNDNKLNIQTATKKFLYELKTKDAIGLYHHHISESLLNLITVINQVVKHYDKLSKNKDSMAEKINLNIASTILLTYQANLTDLLIAFCISTKTESPMLGQVYNLPQNHTSLSYNISD